MFSRESHPVSRCYRAEFELRSLISSMVTIGYKNISQPQNIVLLVMSVLLLPAFSLWVKRQVRHKRAALIPNSVWQNLPFSSICMAMFFTWAAFNAFQYISTLFFQEVQNMSALQASIRFLPMAVVGVLTNTIAAHLVAKVDVNVLLGVSAVITAVSPILMAVASPEWTYWTAAFIAMALSPINGDGEYSLSPTPRVLSSKIPEFSRRPTSKLIHKPPLVLWTVSSLVICRAFPADSQALAGGVFNTISQLGNSVGLAVTAAIAASVSAHDQDGGSSPGDSNTDIETAVRLLQGYRAAYWTIFGGMVVVCTASFLGLRKLGKVGIKQD